MNKYFLASIMLGISLFLSGCSDSAGIDKNASIIFFYGSTCPHCKVVEEYIKNNNIESKIDLAQGEVYNNKDNAQFMMEKQKGCNLEEKMIGAVPFLWTKEKCYLGQDEIIEFLAEKAGN